MAVGAGVAHAGAGAQALALTKVDAVIADDDYLSVADIVEAYNVVFSKIRGISPFDYAHFLRETSIYNEHVRKLLVLSNLLKNFIEKMLPGAEHRDVVIALAKNLSGDDGKEGVAALESLLIEVQASTDEAIKEAIKNVHKYLALYKQGLAELEKAALKIYAFDIAFRKKHFFEPIETALVAKDYKKLKILIGNFLNFGLEFLLAGQYIELYESPMLLWLKTWALALDTHSATYFDDIEVIQDLLMRYSVLHYIDVFRVGAHKEATVGFFLSLDKVDQKIIEHFSEFLGIYYRSAESDLAKILVPDDLEKMINFRAQRIRKNVVGDDFPSFIETYNSTFYHYPCLSNLRYICFKALISFLNYQIGYAEIPVADRLKALELFEHLSQILALMDNVQMLFMPQNIIDEKVIALKDVPLEAQAKLKLFFENFNTRFMRILLQPLSMPKDASAFNKAIAYLLELLHDFYQEIVKKKLKPYIAQAENLLIPMLELLIEGDLSVDDTVRCGAGVAVSSGVIALKPGKLINMLPKDVYSNRENLLQMISFCHLVLELMTACKDFKVIKRSQASLQEQLFKIQEQLLDQYFTNIFMNIAVIQKLTKSEDKILAEYNLISELKVFASALQKDVLDSARVGKALGQLIERIDGYVKRAENPLSALSMMLSLFEKFQGLAKQHGQIARYQAFMTQLNKSRDHLLDEEDTVTAIAGAGAPQRKAKKPQAAKKSAGLEQGSVPTSEAKVASVALPVAEVLVSKRTTHFAMTLEDHDYAQKRTKKVAAALNFFSAMNPGAAIEVSAGPVQTGRARSHSDTCLVMPF